MVSSRDLGWEQDLLPVCRNFQGHGDGSSGDRELRAGGALVLGLSHRQALRGSEAPPAAGASARSTGAGTPRPRPARLRRFASRIRGVPSAVCLCLLGTRSNAARAALRSRQKDRGDVRPASAAGECDAPPKQMPTKRTASPMSANDPKRTFASPLPSRGPLSVAGCTCRVFP